MSTFLHPVTGVIRSSNQHGGEKACGNASDWSVSPEGRHRACPGIDVTTPRVANQDWWSIMAAMVAGEVVDEEDFLLCVGGWITRLHLAKLKRHDWILQAFGTQRSGLNIRCLRDETMWLLRICCFRYQTFPKKGLEYPLWLSRHATQYSHSVICFDSPWWIVMLSVNRSSTVYSGTRRDLHHVVNFSLDYSIRIYLITFCCLQIYIKLNNS